MASYIGSVSKIKKFVLTHGGDFKKEFFYLNGENAYTVNGLTMTGPQMLYRYNRGEL